MLNNSSLSDSDHSSSLITHTSSPELPQLFSESFHLDVDFAESSSRNQSIDASNTTHSSSFDTSLSHHPLTTQLLSLSNVEIINIITQVVHSKGELAEFIQILPVGFSDIVTDEFQRLLAHTQNLLQKPHPLTTSPQSLLKRCNNSSTIIRRVQNPEISSRANPRCTNCGKTRLQGCLGGTGRGKKHRKCSK